MPARIPAHVREQQINSLPNIEFVRWAGEYKNAYSKAIVRCAVDGFEWSPPVNSLINSGCGCPQCAGNRRWTAKERVEQINSLPNIEFVRWVDGYHGKRSKAVCRCAVDGFEWVVAVEGLMRGLGCSNCSGRRRWTAGERITQINAKPNITFVRWVSGYKTSHSKTVVRCALDGFEWCTSVHLLVNCGTGCPQCSKKRRWTAEERIAQINAMPNIEFLRWQDGCHGKRSKAVCRCALDGFEWSTTVDRLCNEGTGCPQCHPGGYNPRNPGTLYILRSECGSMVKIGISNSHKRRHIELRRATPFDWHCIELLHSDDGSLIAEFEKELHSWTEQAEFREPFDGYTEWRKWDARLPRWVERYRARLARIVAP